ncbi:pheromone a factor receptor [Kwoniella mangroviensis CBS 8886]|nr:pheromone a factor receptor [Kwoniella mangroviensis CBS 8886]
MSFQHFEYLLPSLLATILALYPLPWHICTRNIATLSMIFWMTALNMVHNVNCIVWDDNSDIKGKVWGDISTIIIVGYNFALPTAHLLLAKQLESLTTLRPHSPLYDDKAGRKHRMIDLSVTFFAPIVGVLVHLSNINRRFYVVESFGPIPATYWNGWGVFWMAVVPILIALACAVYTALALINIIRRRKQMLSMMATGSSVNKEQFFRLMFLTVAELGTCCLRAIFNLMSFQRGPQSLGHFGPPVHNLRRIETIPLSLVSERGLLVLRLSYFTCVACSYIFFLCFVTSAEVKRFYGLILHRIFPCIPEPTDRAIHLGSLDSGFSGSSTQKIQIHTSTSTYTTEHPSSTNMPLSPLSSSASMSTAIGTVKDKEMSLEDMLGTPVMGPQGVYMPRKGSQASFASNPSDIHLPPMLVDKEKLTVFTVSSEVKK